jgi:hypothetical protein
VQLVEATGHKILASVVGVRDAAGVSAPQTWDAITA